jgi:hypothetical protein
MLMSMESTLRHSDLIRLAKGERTIAVFIALGRSGLMRHPFRDPIEDVLSKSLPAGTLGHSDRRVFPTAGQTGSDAGSRHRAMVESHSRLSSEMNGILPPSHTISPAGDGLNPSRREVYNVPITVSVFRAVAGVIAAVL